MSFIVVYDANVHGFLRVTGANRARHALTLMDTHGP
jgi:hypothetical protein